MYATTRGTVHAYGCAPRPPWKQGKKQSLVTQRLPYPMYLVVVLFRFTWVLFSLPPTRCRKSFVLFLLIKYGGQENLVLFCRYGCKTETKRRRRDITFFGGTQQSYLVHTTVVLRGVEIFYIQIVVLWGRHASSWIPCYPLESTLAGTLRPCL